MYFGDEVAQSAGASGHHTWGFGFDSHWGWSADITNGLMIVYTCYDLSCNECTWFVLIYFKNFMIAKLCLNIDDGHYSNIISPLLIMLGTWWRNRLGRKVSIPGALGSIPPEDDPLISVIQCRFDLYWMNNSKKNWNLVRKCFCIKIRGQNGVDSWKIRCKKSLFTVPLNNHSSCASRVS